MGTARVEVVRILAAVSAVAALALLIAAAFFLDDWRRMLDVCENQIDPRESYLDVDCKTIRIFVASAVLAIVVAIVQLGAAVLPLLEKRKAWVVVKIVLMLVLGAVLIMLMVERVHKIQTTNFEGLDDPSNPQLPYLPPFKYSRPRALTFLAFTAVDIGIALVTMVALS